MSEAAAPDLCVVVANKVMDGVGGVAFIPTQHTVNVRS